ncbi:MAG: hypothetical protein QM689_09390 [Oscillospiraceae bacterium]
MPQQAGGAFHGGANALFDPTLTSGIIFTLAGKNMTGSFGKRIDRNREMVYDN